MPTEAHPSPVPPTDAKKPRSQKAQTLQSDVASATDQVSSFISLKNQLARVEGSLSNKEASLALARDLLRAREEELSRLRHVLAERDADLSKSAAKAAALKCELARVHSELEHQHGEAIELRLELTKARGQMSSWFGLLRAFARKLLLSARYGLLPGER